MMKTTDDDDDDGEMNNNSFCFTMMNEKFIFYYYFCSIQCKTRLLKLYWQRNELNDHIMFGYKFKLT